MATQIVSNQVGQQILSHLHPLILKCYPTLVDDVTLTTGAANYAADGALTEIVPVSTITSNYDIIGIVIANAAVDRYELSLYYGAGDTEFGRVRFASGAAGTHVGFIPFESPMIAANSRIKSRLYGKTGAGTTVAISLVYHIHT